MKAIKEIKTNFGKNVKYYNIGANSETAKCFSSVGQNKCNTRILKVTNYKGNITKERFHAFLGREFMTDLECVRYYSKYYSTNQTN